MPTRSEMTWEKNAPSQIGLNSIFAALSAALIVFIIQDQQAARWEWWCLILLVFSFLFFAISAEKILNALDERDVRKYAYYMLPYNLGAICVGVAIELMMHARFGAKITDHLKPYLGDFSNWSWILWWLVGGVLLQSWIRDTWFLFFESKAGFDEWLEELQDKRVPKQDHGALMKLFFRIRKQLHG